MQRLNFYEFEMLSLLMFVHEYAGIYVYLYKNMIAYLCHINIFVVISPYVVLRMMIHINAGGGLFFLFF